MTKNAWIVTNEVPSLSSGATIRSYQLLRQYIKHGYGVTLFSLSDRHKNEEPEIEHIRNDLGIEVLCAPLPKGLPSGTSSAGFSSRIHTLLARYRQSELKNLLLKEALNRSVDVIQLEMLYSYHAVQPVLQKLREQGTRILLDAHNVEQKLFRQCLPLLSPAQRLLGQYVLQRYRAIEMQAASFVDGIFACSASDADFFRNLNDNVFVLPNGADCQRFKLRPPVGNKTILFMGGTHYPPNEEALKWYFSEIYPEVKERVPEVRTYLLGSDPAAWLRQLAEHDPSVVLPGHVEDVRDYLELADVCISPIRSGSGTSLKTVEYLAAGRPVVSTRVGVRGLNVQDRSEALITDNAIDFAKSIIELLNDTAHGRLIGERAQKLMQDSYDWDVIGDQLDQQVMSLAFSQS